MEIDRKQMNEAKVAREARKRPEASHADESAEWTMCLNGTCRQAACPG